MNTIIKNGRNCFGKEVTLVVNEKGNYSMRIENQVLRSFRKNKDKAFSEFDKYCCS